jgi:hypothetical protein
MFALVNGTELVLGPIEFNYRLINSTLEDELEIDYRVQPSDHANVPLLITEEIKLLKVVYDKPEYDGRYEEIFLYKYEIINDEAVFYYQKSSIDLDKIKSDYKAVISNERWIKENSGYITQSINNTEIQISTNRETRISLVTKLASGSGPYNFKFGDTWAEITGEDIGQIITKIDQKIQADFDWELEKINEINSCSSVDELNAIDFFDVENNINTATGSMRAY